MSPTDSGDNRRIEPRHLACMLAQIAQGDRDPRNALIRDISTTGASHCDINVLNSLNVSTTGSSEIRYRGNPTNVNTSKTGASSVTKID